MIASPPARLRGLLGGLLFLSLALCVACRPSMEASVNDAETLSSDAPEFERQQAARRLAKKPEAVDALLRAIVSDPDLSVRMTSVESLSRIASPEAVDALLSLWKDPSPPVDAALQLHSVWALEQIGEPARAPVRAKLSDTNPHVRWLAVQATAKLGGDGLREALTPLAEDKADKVRDEARRQLERLP